MKATTLLNEEKLVRKAVATLLDNLGPIESSRFLAMPFDKGRLDSVKRHRQWQKDLEQTDFFNRVFPKDR